MKRKNNKGFTLIEILAAIVILGIISTIAVPAVYKYVTKTKDFSYEIIIIDNINHRLIMFKMALSV